MEKYQGDWSWYLLGEGEDGTIAKFPIPDRAAGKITEEILRHSKIEDAEAPDDVRDLLVSIMKRNNISVDIIAKLVRISSDRLEYFINGKPLIINVDESIELGKILELLK